MSLPSVRECLQRLDRLRDTGTVVNELRALDEGVFVSSMSESAPEIVKAIARLNDLHQLCLHMAANMSGGFGVPPTATRERKAEAQAMPVAAAPKPQGKHYAKTPTPPIERRKAEPKPKTTRVHGSVRARIAPSRLPDVYFTSEAMQVLGISATTFFLLRTNGELSPVSGTAGRERQWSRAAVDALAEKRKLHPPACGRPSKAVLAARQAALATSSQTPPGESSTTEESHVN